MLYKVNHKIQLWGHENTSQSLQLHELQPHDKLHTAQSIILSLCLLQPTEMAHIKPSPNSYRQATKSSKVLLKKKTLGKGT